MRQGTAMRPAVIGQQAKEGRPQAARQAARQAQKAARQAQKAARQAQKEARQAQGAGQPHLHQPRRLSQHN